MNIFLVFQSIYQKRKVFKVDLKEYFDWYKQFSFISKPQTHCHHIVINTFLMYVCDIGLKIS